jgi:SAM-dependent methyltransferase
MSESFRPVSNTRTNSLLGKLKFHGRMVLDLQILTIFRHLKELLPSLRGRVLDVGCGQSPYRFLLSPGAAEYKGIDIPDANNKFDYQNPDVTPFDGETIPFEANAFDGVICTEVLEHVAHYQRLVDEMLRVTKPGGRVISTIPWSARYHYIPFDFFRYTPSALRRIFAGFAQVEIRPRGSDIAVIANKMIVLWFRHLLPRKPARLVFVPVWLVLSPILIVAVACAHLSFFLKWGSDEDPLGYTVIATK